MRKLLFLILFGLSTLVYAGFPLRPSTHIADDANLLSADDEQNLSTKMLYPADMYILTLESLNGHNIDDVANMTKNNWNLNNNTVLTILSLNPRKIGTYVGKNYSDYVTSADVSDYNETAKNYFKEKNFVNGFDFIIVKIQNKIETQILVTSQTQSNTVSSPSNVQTSNTIQNDKPRDYGWFWWLIGTLTTIVIGSLIGKKLFDNHQKKQDRILFEEKFIRLIREIDDYIKDKNLYPLNLDFSEIQIFKTTSVHLFTVDNYDKLTNAFKIIKEREQIFKAFDLSKVKDEYYLLKAKLPTQTDYDKYNYEYHAGIVALVTQVNNQFNTLLDYINTYNSSYNNVVAINKELDNLRKKVNNIVSQYNNNIKVYNNFYSGVLHSEVVNSKYYNDTLSNIESFRNTINKSSGYDKVLQSVNLNEGSLKTELDNISLHFNKLNKDDGNYFAEYKKLKDLNKTAYAAIETINGLIEDHNKEYKREQERNRLYSSGRSSYGSSNTTNHYHGSGDNLTSFATGYMLGSSNSHSISSSNDDDYRRKSSFDSGSTSDWGSSNSSDSWGSSSSSDWGSSDSSSSSDW